MVKVSKAVANKALDRLELSNIFAVDQLQMRFTDAKRIYFDAALAARYDVDERQAMWRLWTARRLGLSTNRWLLEQFNEIPSESLQILKVDVEVLQSGKPLQYLLNVADFLGRPYILNEAVLIPRPETEELVQWILQKLDGRKRHLIDLGTGSGVIPVSLKLERPHWEVTGLDLSESALSTAQANGNALGADVTWLLGDMLLGNWSDFDVVVSNPPYIPRCDAPSLSQHVLDFEPEMALFVSDERPLLFYEHIAAIAQHAEPEKHFFMELNHEKALDIQGLFHGLQSELKPDLQGKLRMLHVQT